MADDTASVSCYISKATKESLLERVSRLQVKNSKVGLSDLIRLAISYQEERQWKDIPQAAA